MPAELSPPEPIRVRVVGARLEADGVRSFALADETGADLPEWDAGAHIDVLIPGGLVRQYSLCGDPADRGNWRIAVLREEESRGGSAHLHDEVGIGSILEVREPRNNFQLDSAPHYLFIAGGIGITPLLPMINAAESRNAQWQLHYGGRQRSRMAFLDELAGHQDRVSVVPQDERGLLPLDAILDQAPEEALVYCCGPEALLDAVENAWTGKPDALHVERFRPRTTTTTPEEEVPFEVVVQSSGRSVEVRPGVSILDALARAGMEMPSSCREGTCASCETTVVEGAVDHRDSVLTAQEKDAGKTMMICVSRARSGRLILDI